MSKFYDNFDFIGELAIPNDDDRFLDIRDNGKGWIGYRLNFGIMESKYNSQFVELYGGYMNGTGAVNQVYTFSKGNRNQKGSPIQIPWEDRLNESSVDMVADFAKIIVDFETDFDKKEKYMEINYKIRNLEYEGKLDGSKQEELAKLKAEFKELATNRKEFVHEYDAIQFISSKLKDLTDYKFRVQGKPVLSEWQGKFYTNFEPEIIEIVPEHYTNQLKVQADVFFLPDSIDESSVKDNGKIYVDGYMQDYVRESKRDELFPRVFVINTNKLDMENEKHVNLLEFMKGQFKTENNHLYHLPWEINLYRGAEVVETEDALTENQKNAIAVGLSKKEDFNTTMFGENIEEYRLAKPLLNRGFANGAVDTGHTEAEALELVCQPTGDIAMDDIMPEKSKEEDVSEEVADVMDELFG